MLGPPPPVRRSDSDPNSKSMERFKNGSSHNTWGGTGTDKKELYPAMPSFDEPGGSGSSSPKQRQHSGDRPDRQPSRDLSLMLDSLAPTSVVISPDPTTAKKNVILIGVNASDRVGLLHDVSRGMSKLGLQALHTEASVVGLRSVSIWRCEVGGALRRERRRRFGIDEGDVEEIWAVLHAILQEDTGTEAIKQRGLRVIRTRVVEGSGLVGKTANEAGFRVR